MHDLIEKFSVMCYWKPLLCQPLHILCAAACNILYKKVNSISHLIGSQ